MGAKSQKEEKTRYTDEELNEFRILIEEKIEKAKEQLAMYLSQLTAIGENGDTKLRGLDDSTSSVEAERLTTLAARQRKHIQYLEYALMRIENKVYGICRETGRLISKGRLRAVPHATLSIQAKQGR